MEDINFLKLMLCAAGAYLLGSVNSGIIITKWSTGLDLRKYGSGNAGTTNAYRMLGARKTFLVILGDALKGVLAVFLGWWLFGDYGRICAFMFVIIGHVYPCFFGFKGVRRAHHRRDDGGVRLAHRADFGEHLHRRAGADALRVPGFLRGRLLHALFHALFLRDQMIFTICAMFISMWIILLHASNLRRIKNGTESRFNFNAGACPARAGGRKRRRAG